MKYSILLTLFVSIFLTACQQTIDSPKQVAEKYWQALKNGDTATAKKLVSTNTQTTLDAYLALPAEEKISLEDIKLNTEQATVGTIITKGANTTDSNQSQTIDFDTVLILENNQWKIDASRTQVPAPTKQIDTSNDNKLSDALQENLDSMDEALEEGADMLNQFMQEGSREMSESLLKGMNKMNEALQEAIEKMKQRREQQSPPNQPANGTNNKNGEGLI